MSLISISCILLVLGLTFTTTAQETKTYIKELQQERKEKQASLKRKKSSPLNKEDRKHFAGLNYFPIDTSYQVNAVFVEVDAKDTISIPTSAGRSKDFVRYGMFLLSFDKAQDTLYGYKRVWPEGYTYDGEPYIFLPFNDETNGDLTYGGGRYLDLSIPAKTEREVVIDFNRCYNPYCAYGGGFSCPIPPRENRLNRPILAGEKNYDH